MGDENDEDGGTTRNLRMMQMVMVIMLMGMVIVIMMRGMVMRVIPVFVSLCLASRSSKPMLMLIFLVWMLIQ